VRKHPSPFALVITMVCMLSGMVRAQDQKTVPERPSATAMVPLKVQLVISRFQGDKRISSVPYTLTVTATDATNRFDEPSRLRMGVQIPVPPLVTPTQDGKPSTGAQPLAVQYRDVGTNIDCAAKTIDGGRFKLTITIEESSLYGDEDKSQVTKSAGPAFRQFRVTSVVVLKDGQSEQFSTATERISGEVVKMDVTLSVMK
jgi:hypothetical protein